jgi:hypothetical protein
MPGGDLLDSEEVSGWAHPAICRGLTRQTSGWVAACLYRGILTSMFGLPDSRTLASGLLGRRQRQQRLDSEPNRPHDRSR